MAFPSSPTNNQIATVGGITYTYNSTKTAWVRVPSSGTDLVANTLVLNSTQTSTSTTTGALKVGGGAGVGGNLYVGGGINVAGSVILGNITTSIMTATISSSLGAATATTFVASGSGQVLSLGVGTAASGTTGEIRATNAITAFYSDKRLKTNIQEITNALDKLEQISGVTYTQNELAEQYGYNDYCRQVGVFAQDVQRVQPEAVKPAPFDIAEDGSSKSGEYYLTVQYDKLVPLLIEAIKELRREINQLKGQ